MKWNKINTQSITPNKKFIPLFLNYIINVIDKYTVHAIEPINNTQPQIL